METALQPGTILLAKYRVEHLLGQGGMGVVVAARHLKLGELFAIKLMLPAALHNPEAVERFLREARAASKLKGEHVARVTDVDTFPDGLPYMVMEHLTGQDLSKVLDQRGTLSVEETALYVYQASEAIAEAHAKHIIHRDLKPSNLFLTQRANGTPCIKVLDFGISKDVDPNAKVAKKLTQTGLMFGSPSYMPPEQMRNVKAVDTRTDIWALGMILYECVTGQVAFDANEFTELIAKVISDAPVAPSHLRPGLPPQFESIILKCLEKNPDRRFGSVRELMAALQPFTTGQAKQTMMGVQPGPASRRAERVQDTTTVVFERQSKLPAADKGTVVMRGPVPRESAPGDQEGKPLQGGQTQKAWNSNQPQPGSPKNNKMLTLVGVFVGIAAVVAVVVFVVTRENPITTRASTANAASTESTTAPPATVTASLIATINPIATIATNPASSTPTSIPPQASDTSLRVEDLPTVEAKPVATAKAIGAPKPSAATTTQPIATQPKPETTSPSPPIEPPAPSVKPTPTAKQPGYDD